MQVDKDGYVQIYPTEFMITEKEMIELRKQWKLSTQDKIAVIKILLEDAYFEKYGEKLKHDGK